MKTRLRNGAAAISAACIAACGAALLASAGTGSLAFIYEAPPPSPKNGEPDASVRIHASGEVIPCAEAL